MNAFVENMSGESQSSQLKEEDTCNALRRVPFRVLFVSLLDPIILGQAIIPEDRLDRIIEAGWTKEEFDQVLQEEIQKGNITGSVAVLQSKNWRNTFLKKTPIY